MKQPSDTRSRILDVAEELFGEQGLDRVSIRDITRKAKVNLAAINYHFGSKEDLVVAVFERSEEHTSELQSPDHLVCRLLLEKKNIVIIVYLTTYYSVQ